MSNLEGTNNLIKTTKRKAYEYRNMHYFKLKVMQIAGFMSSRYMDLNGKWTPAGEELLLRKEITQL